MGDRTALQVNIYACPDDQRQAAAEVLADGYWENGGNGERFAVFDYMRNPDGQPITRAYEDVLTVGTFATQAEADEHAAGLNASWGEDDERYGTGSVPDVNLDEEYLETERSWGAADEIAEALMEAAPGCSFVLWQDPGYCDGLSCPGDVRAYTPALGLYAAECDANGTPCLTPETIRATVAGATDAVQAALDPIMDLTGDAERAQVAVQTILAEIDRKTGKPWFDDWQNIGATHGGTRVPPEEVIRLGNAGILA